jgi:non-specific serine/threonine protein kinase
VRSGTAAHSVVPGALTRGAATARSAVAERSATPRVSGPREACGNRTQFALYRCMQTQCEKWQWSQHPQCKRLRARDDID